MSSLTDLFSNIANQIRGKTGNTGTIIASDFPTAISNIPDLVSSTADATAIAGNLFSGKTAYAKGAKIVGTMVDRGNLSQSLNCGETFTIPVGYHSGAGIISANSLASQTVGTATASDIINGKTAWVGGNNLIGTLSKLGACVYGAYQFYAIKTTHEEYRRRISTPFYFADDVTVNRQNLVYIGNIGYYSEADALASSKKYVGKYVFNPPSPYTTVLDVYKADRHDAFYGEDYDVGFFYTEQADRCTTAQARKGFRVCEDKGAEFDEDGYYFKLLQVTGEP